MPRDEVATLYNSNEYYQKIPNKERFVISIKVDPDYICKSGYQHGLEVGVLKTSDIFWSTICLHYYVLINSSYSFQNLPN